MRYRRTLAKVSLVLAALLVSVELSAAQSKSPGSGNVTFTVTAASKKDASPAISKDDVQLFQGKERKQIADWKKGDELFLAILIDDSLDTDVGGQWGDLKKFITSQPASTHIAVGYIRNNSTMIAQDFTDNHEQAANAVRLPMGPGAIGSSPYLGTLDMLKRWPQTGPRRSIILISSGIDFFRGRGSQVFNPDLDSVIQRAQRQNTNIWGVYYPAAGHRFARSFYLLTYAQNNLDKLAEDTGAETYFLGIGTPVSLGPYFEEINRHLNNQYLLTFAGTGDAKGKFVNVKVRTEVPGVELMVPSAVFVGPSRGE